MKKSVLFLVVLAMVSVFGIASSEGASSALAPFTSDEMTVLSRSDLGGIDSGVIFLNKSNNTALAVVQDPDGNPDPALVGFAFLYLDFFTNNLWGSNDGKNWEIIQ